MNALVMGTMASEGTMQAARVMQEMLELTRAMMARRALAREAARGRPTALVLATTWPPQRMRADARTHDRDKLGSVIYMETEHLDQGYIADIMIVIGAMGLANVMNGTVVMVIMPPGTMALACMKGGSGGEGNVYEMTNGLDITVGPASFTNDCVAAEGPVGAGMMRSRLRTMGPTGLASSTGMAGKGAVVRVALVRGGATPTDRRRYIPAELRDGAKLERQTNGGPAVPRSRRHTDLLVPSLLPTVALSRFGCDRRRGCICRICRRKGEVVPWPRESTATR